MNYGTRQARCRAIARVGETQVKCRPSTLDLLANEPPQSVRIIVPRPALGDLVPEFNHETTLYDKTLRITATAEDQETSAEWHELVYSPEENGQRHMIQQRKWRIAKGEETVDDRRQEYLDDRERRMAERPDKPNDYIEF